MSENKIRYFNRSTLFLVVSASLVIINRLVNDTNLLKITLLVYILLLLYKLVSTGVSFFKYYNNEHSFKKNIFMYVEKYSPTFYNILTQEILILNYAFVVWKKSNKTLTNSFESYKQNPNIALYLGLLFVLLVEAFIVDLLLVKLSFIFWARISIFSTFYIIIIFLSHIKALKFRITTFSDNYLSVKYGIIRELKLPYEIFSLKNETNNEDNIVPLGLMSKMETHNITIYFKTTQSIPRIYGIKKEGNGISFYISDNENFKNMLAEKLVK